MNNAQAIIFKQIKAVKYIFGKEIYISVEKDVDEFFISINSWDIFNSKEFQNILFGFYCDNEKNGIDSFWGVDETLLADKLDAVQQYFFVEPEFIPLFQKNIFKTNINNSINFISFDQIPQLQSLGIMTSSNMFEANSGKLFFTLDSIDIQDVLLFYRDNSRESDTIDVEDKKESFNKTVPFHANNNFALAA